MKDLDQDEIDWSEGFDDMDAEYWEDYLGGPDNDEIASGYIFEDFEF